MTSGQNQVVPAGVTGISRRTVVKGAAWTAPVVAVAVAAPMAAASSEPVQCIDAVNGHFSRPTTGTLYHDGNEVKAVAGTGALGVTPWPENPESRDMPIYTTGFTPALMHSELLDRDSAAKGRIAGSVQAGDVIAGDLYGFTDVGGKAGFLSMDDGRNPDGSTAPVTFSITFTAQLPKAGDYTFSLPVRFASPHNLQQLLKIAVSGAGMEETTVARVKYGLSDDWATDTSNVLEYDSYTQSANDQETYEQTIRATQSGTLTFTYTFTLPIGRYTNQHADIWVEAPSTGELCAP